MLYRFLLLCFIPFQLLCPEIHARELSTTEMELRDLVTQKSVIQRANMASFMRNYRDGVVLAVERESCLAAELRIIHASKDLLLAISTLEGLHLPTNLGQLSVQSEAVKSIREAMVYIDDVQQYLNRWALNGL